MNIIVSKMKWLIIAILVVLVAGMTMFGIMGFNNTVDYSDSYEVQVSVDQTISSAKETLKNTTEKYFSEKGISAVSYATQTGDEGATLIYKFNQDISAKVVDLESALNTALEANDATKGVTAKVAVAVLDGDNSMQVGWLLLALGIAVVVIFLYTLIMEKLASAVAVICSAILSFLVFVALTSITRIPAIPYVEVLTAFSAVLGAVLSVTTVGRYKEELKNATGKVNTGELAVKVANAECKKYLFTLISVFIAAVAVSAFFMPYMMFAGGQILIAGVSAVAVSYTITPVIWTAVKGSIVK